MFPVNEDDQGQQINDRYKISFHADGLGRLQRLEAPDSPTDPAPSGTRTYDPTVVQYQYLGSRVWERAHSNGTAQRYFTGTPTSPDHYDKLGRLRVVESVATGTPGDVLPSFKYEYDRVGNRMYEQRGHETITASGPDYRTRAYTHDLLNRLTKWNEGPLPADPFPSTQADPAGQVTSPLQTEGWTLDTVGNWQTHTPSIGVSADDFTQNELNQYSKINREGTGPDLDLAYDWLGQLRDDATKGQGQEYVWDVFGRLTEVASDASVAFAWYRYDAFGRRVEKVVDPNHSVPDKTTLFIYDGLRSIEERAVLGLPGSERESVRARYGFGLGLDEVIWMDRNVDGADEIIESRYFLHHDGLGSVVAATKDTGNPADAVDVVERFTYSAYGVVSSWNLDWIDPNDPGETPGYADQAPGGLSSIGLPFLYTGQRYDPESGLYNYKKRMHDPQLGRFISRDPIGYAEGPSLYQYAASSPIVLTDPLGLAATVPDWHWSRSTRTLLLAGWRAVSSTRCVRSVRTMRKGAFPRS